MSRDNQFGGGGGGQGGGPQFGGYPMSPYGMGMPIIIRNDQQQRNNEPTEPPLRVQIAMMLNGALTRKQMPQVAVTEHTVETIPGQKLTEEEMGAQATAMNAMSHYLAGDLQPDIWEAQSLTQNTGIPTIMFRCVCVRADHSTNPDCPFCSGEGEMDIVVKNPRKATVDAQGNLTVGGVISRTQTTNGVQPVAVPAPGKTPGRRPPRGPRNEGEANET